jgi:tetratricopeptide (TPR) repeat protein
MPMSFVFPFIQLLCISILLADVLPANASDDKSRGIAEYEATNYDKAIAYFDTAITNRPNDAVLHYYLANSFSRTNQFDNALKEYTLGLSLSQDQTLGHYCQSAIDSLEKLLAKPGKVAINNSESKNQNEQTKLASSSKKQDDGVSPKPALNNPAKRDIQSDLLRHTVERINSQASVGNITLQNEGKNLAKTKAGSHDLNIAKLREEEIARLDYMQNTVAYNCFGKPYHLFTESDIRLAKENYELKILEAQTKSTSDVQSVLDQGHLREKALSETANSLVSQLGKTAPSSPGSAQLLPTGTNIYVRNYLSTGLPSSNMLPRELLATQDKMILEPHKREGKWHYSIVPDGLGAKQESLSLNNQHLYNSNKSEKFTNTGVRGQLLPKPE